MITDVSEFKQRLQSIQQNSSVVYTTLPSSEPRLIIDANSREISIPVEFDFLAVKNDHKAETIYFEIDRYFDDNDLSEQTCVIQWTNQGDEGISPCTEMDIDTFDGKIIFGWEITSDCTRHAGNISFSVRFYTIDEIGNFEYNFNTLPATSKVLDTLNSYGEKEPVNPSTFQVWVDRLYFLEKNSITKDDLEEIGPGAPGADGEDGKTPYIQDGYWYIDGVNTDVKAEGVDGKDGASAYEVWLSAGHSGSEDDFLQWLKGDNDPFGDVVTTIAYDGIPAGTSLNGKTVKEVLIMLLGIQDAPKPAVEYIMENSIPCYSGLEDGEFSEVAYQQLDTATADYTDQGFYTTTDDNGEITNAGYQVTFEENTEGVAQTFAIYSDAKIVTAYQYQPALNQWLDMGFDGTYWVEDGTTTEVIDGQEVTYTTHTYNVELMGDAITAPEYWRFEVEVL